MFRLHDRQVDDVTIFDVFGEIAPGTAEEELDARIQLALARGCRKVVLNLAHARASSNVAVNVLLGARIIACEAGGDIRLSCISRRGIDTAVLVALCTYFSAFDGEQDALASFMDVTPVATAAAPRTRPLAAATPPQEAVIV